MAQVQIKGGIGRSYSVIVDGVDVSAWLLAEGFTLTIGKNREAIISARLMATAVDIDLPESVVRVEAAS
jgi:hypothetical protein